MVAISITIMLLELSLDWPAMRYVRRKLQIVVAPRIHRRIDLYRAGVSPAYQWPARRAFDIFVLAFETLEEVPVSILFLSILLGQPLAELPAPPTPLHRLPAPPGGIRSYADAYEEALRDRKRLLIFVGVYGREVDGCVRCAFKRFPGAKEGTVVVYGPKGGDLHYLGELDANASDAALKGVGQQASFFGLPFRNVRREGADRSPVGDDK